MYKLVTFAGYDDRHGPHLFPIEPDRERTIGHIKMARPLPPKVEHYIRTAKPIPGKTQLLIDALGAGEYYGCFPAGTLIRTEEGLVAIEDVREGVSVLTHTGHYRPVTETFTRPHEGWLYSIYVAGFSTQRATMIATGNHPVLAIPRDEMISTRRRIVYKGDRDIPLAVRREELLRQLEPSWIRADELSPGDYVAQPIPQEEDWGDIPSEWRSANIGYLLGAFVANGCTAKDYDKTKNLRNPWTKLVFLYGASKRDAVARIESAISELDHKPYSSSPTDNTIRIETTNAPMARWVRENIGTGAHTKRLSPTILRAPRWWQKEFWQGYFDGDGYTSTQGNDAGTLRCSSVSYELLLDLRLLLARQGILLALNERHNTKATYYNEQPIFEGSVSALQAVDDDRARPEGYVSSSHVFTRVRSVQEIAGAGAVYNIEVADDNSYVVGNCAVHNSNSNGDYFPEEALKHKGADYGYETFMHYAYPFKHHCFPGETPVLMADGSCRPIATVVQGDSVMTLHGPRPVLETMRRKYAGDGISLELHGEPVPLIGTEDHPVRVYRRESLHCPHRCSYLAPSFGCEYKDCKARAGGIGDPEWAPISSVLPGDYLVVPKPKCGSVTVPGEFASLVGWVASEGHLGDRGLIQFTFASDNRSDIDAVKSCLRENGTQPGETQREDGLTSVYGCSQELHAQLSLYVQGVLNDKTLTPEVFAWSPESLLRLLGSYIDGDGSIASMGKNRGILRIRSSSKKMLHSLSTIIRSLGVWTSVNHDCPPGEMVSPTNGALYKTAGSGVVTIAKSRSQYIAKYSRKTVSAPCSRAERVHWTDDLYLVRVTGAEPVELAEDVFNLEVADVHHYIAGGVVVHNCNKDPARAYGDKVTLSEYDPQMHRVLLIVRVDDSKCQDILGDLAQGRYWSVSMGCRVPWDECSICKNRAKNRGQYCPHLRYQMNRILQDGRRVCAYNWLPKFFDISFVTIGAEKASYVLKKVAMTHVALTPDGPEIGGWIQSSAELGESYYSKLSSATKKAVQKKRADIDKDVPSQPPANISAVTLEDKKKLDSFLCDAGDVKAGEKPIPTHTLNALAAHPIRDVFSTTAALGIDLRPHEFQRIILVKQGAAKLADAFDRHRLMFDERSPGPEPSWARQIRWDPSALNEKVAMLLQPYVAERSCYPEILHARLERMEKRAALEGYDQENKWYPLTEEGRRASSGMPGVLPASTALAAGFMAFRQLFPETIGKGPKALQAFARHPWLLPILVGAGVGASVGLKMSTEPRPLGPHGTGDGLDGIKRASYDGAKTAGAINPLTRIGLIPLAYIYAGIQQKRWQRGERLNAVDRFIAKRPDLAGLAGFAVAPGVAKGFKHLTKHGSALGNMALYTIGSTSKLMPAVLAGAALDTAIFKMIGRLAARKGNKKHGNTR